MSVIGNDRRFTLNVTEHRLLRQKSFLRNGSKRRSHAVAIGNSGWAVVLDQMEGP